MENNRIDYHFQESLVTRQNRAEREMLDKFHAGDYTMEHPLICVNPYFISPLSAVILFRTEKKTAVTLTVKGKEAEGDITHTFAPATEHVLPVLGLYADHDNTVELRAYQSEAVCHTIHTEPLSDNVPHLISIETTPAYMEDNLIFLSPSMSELATAIDYRGDIRWHLNVPTVFDIARVKNGNLLISTDRLVRMPYYLSGLYEMTLTGKVVREYSMPGGYHHDKIEMADGNLLVLSEDLESDTVEDTMVLLDRNTGEVLRTWDFSDFLTPGESKSGSWSAEDWFHCNALWYDANTNSVTLSGRHINAMVNIDYDTGKLNWILGDPEGWSDERKKYLFTPVGDGEFDWQYEQHACVITPDGDVMCFDNGHYRSCAPEKYILNRDNFSRGVRYRINTDDMTIQQLWQYGKELGQHFFSKYICNVEYYGEGHYMIHSGGIQYQGENAMEGFAVLAADDPTIRSKSITVEVCEGQKMLEMQVTGNYYRAEKLRLYHDGDNLPLGDGVRLGHMGHTREFDTIIPMEPCGELLPERYEAKLTEEDDRIVLNAIFESGQLVMMMLENANEEHAYYISTARTPFNALCCGTFIEKDARKVNISVNKAGLSGTYDLRFIVDDKKFDTGIQITC